MNKENDASRDYPMPPTNPMATSDPQGAKIPRSRIREANRKSPGTATLLSLMPGLGQVYLGFYRRGFLYMGVVAFVITMLDSGVGSLEPLFGFSLSFFWIYNMIDANRLAKLYNRAVELGEELDTGEPIKLPDTGGSLFGGVVLMAVGFLLLLHLKFDVSMNWIEEWWPVLPIALGAYLVWKSIKSRQDRDL